jgi:hypothetical protein
MCASIGVTGDPRAANCPRRRAIALPHSRRLCAAAASLPPPLLDARNSVPSTARANMCASIGVTGDPRAANCPRRRAIALPHSRRLLTPTVRGSRLTPAAASRCSKICPIDRPRQHVCKHRCDRRPTGGKLHCQRRRAIALPQSLRLRTPTGTVAAAVARWSKIDRVDDRRHYVCQHRRDQRPKVRHTVCRCRANALRHWLRLRAPTGTVTASRVDPPATRWPHALAPHHTERSRNPRVREPAPHRAARLRTLP